MKAKQFLLAGLAATTLVNLTGCFPLVATGITTGAVVAADPRSAGTVLDDQTTALRVSRQIAETFGKNVHVSVTSYDRNLLLTGEVPDETRRQEVERIAAATPNVHKVFNELRLAFPSPLSARSFDAYLTAAVKARLLTSPALDGVKVKVVTENKVVYLLGKLRQQEAQIAANLAASTGGVEKIVKMFEYTSAGPAMGSSGQ